MCFQNVNVKSCVNESPTNFSIPKINKLSVNNFDQSQELIIKDLENSMNFIKTDLNSHSTVNNMKSDYGCFIPIEQNNKLTSHDKIHIQSNQNLPKIKKKVNYLNHKFVISETEDISLDKLLSSTSNENLESNLLEMKTKINASKPKLPAVLPRPPKQGESILKSTINQDIHKKIYCVENNKMKPITSTAVSSGIFRAKKPKYSENKCTELSNILISKNMQGKIVHKSQIEEITTPLKIDNEKPATVTSLNTTSTTDDVLTNLKNGGNYNRQFIKIPLSVLPALDKVDGNDKVNGICDNLKAKLTTNNLVLNIVNMVTNNPEITKNSEIIHR